MRATNATTGSNALFSANEQGAMAAAGYTTNVVLVGYGYTNFKGYRPAI